MEELERQEQGASSATETTGADEQTVTLEKLKEQAQQLGGIVLTEKELQSIIDREITKAIRTREENLKKEQEKKLLEEQGKYEEILKLERKEALEKIKKEFLQARELSELSDFIDVSLLTNKSITEATSELTNLLNTIDKLINEIVEKRVKETQKTIPKPVKTEQISDVRQALIERLKQ